MAEQRGDKVDIYTGNGNLAGNTSWTKVGQITDKSGPAFMADMLESTSSDDEWKTYIYGQKDLGELTFSLRWDVNLPQHGNGAGSLRQAQRDDEIIAIRIDVPGAPQERITFDALVQEVSPDFPMNDVMMAEVTLKPSGAPTFA